MENRVEIVDSIESIRLPVAWEEGEAFDLLQFQAGRAYILDQLGVDSKPEHVVGEYGTNALYMVFGDGSLWRLDKREYNAEDEVWYSFRDFVLERLLPKISARGFAWDSSGAGDGVGPAPLNEIDRKLLVLYCDGDADEARKLVS